MKEQTLNIFNKNTDVFVSTLVQASAGTGKTTLLEHVILRMLTEDNSETCQGISACNFLITTFTNNAISEIKNRIFRNIQKALNFLENEDIISLQQEYPYMLNNDHIDNRKNKILILAKALSDIDTFQIITLEKLKITFAKEVTVFFDVVSFLENSKDEINLMLSDVIKNIIHRFDKEKFFEFSNIVYVALPPSDDDCVYITLYERIVNSINSTKLLLSYNKIMSLYGNTISLEGLYEILNMEIERYASLSEGKRQKADLILDIVCTIILVCLRKNNIVVPDDFIFEFYNYDNNKLMKIKNIKVMLIDEAQDTSESDYKLLETIYKCCEKPPIVYIVGDPKQSLYEFRGGNSSLFLNTNSKNLMNINRTCSLNLNFRSCKKIIEFFNMFFAKHTSNRFLFQKHNCQSLNYDGSVTIYVAPNKNTNKNKQYVSYAMKYIYKYIHEFGPSNIAIVSQNKKHLKDVGIMLKQHEIEFSMPSDCGNHALEILLAILSIKERPGDKVMHFLIENLFLGTDDDLINHKDEIYGLIGFFKRVSIKENLTYLINSILESKNPIYENASIGETLAAFGKINICNDFYNIISDINEHITNINENTTSETWSTKKIIDILGKKASASIKDHVIKSAQVKNSVALHTIHSAKGLEYDIVIFLNIGNSIRKANDDILEDLNRLYVAVTRAKKHLHIFDGSKQQYFLHLQKDYPDDFIEGGQVLVNQEKCHHVDDQCYNENDSKVYVKNVSYTTYTSSNALNINCNKYPFIINLDKKNNAYYKYVGVVFHRIIENLMYGDDDYIESLLDKEINKFFIIQHMKKHIFDMLKRAPNSKIFLINGEMISLISVIEKGLHPVFREFKFFIDNKDHVKLGIIDVIIFVQSEKKIILVDWKTSEFSLNDEDNFDLMLFRDFVNEKYGTQKSIYVESIKKIYSDIYKFVEFIFVFPCHSVKGEVLHVKFDYEF